MARIVLLGSGQSGSTLLGMGLALSPEVSMLGEISELGRVDPTQHACTCGALFGACPLWGRMFEEGLAAVPYGPHVLARATARALEVDHTRHVVDSCKGELGLEVEHALGLDDTHLLYLVRHPCGYVYSQLHNGYELEYALDAWIDEQTRLLRKLADWDRPWSLVRYEELARDPGAELGRLGHVLSIAGPFGERGQSWDFEQASWSAGQHVLSGAAWRLHALPPSVQEDVRWRHALARKAVQTVVTACRPLLERFGYDAQNC
jgi:hypothetical protein